MNNVIFFCANYVDSDMDTEPGYASEPEWCSNSSPNCKLDYTKKHCKRLCTDKDGR